MGVSLAYRLVLRRPNGETLIVGGSALNDGTTVQRRAKQLHDRDGEAGVLFLVDQANRERLHCWTVEATPRPCTSGEWGADSSG